MNNIENEVRRNIGDLTLEDYQLKRLRETVNFARVNSPFFSELLSDVPEIETLEDLRKVPFTTPDDLRNTPYRMLCVSLSGVARVFAHFTTGTLGEPKKIFFSDADVKHIVKSMGAITANVIEAAGLRIADAKVGIYLPNVGQPLSMAEMIAQGCSLIGGKSYIGSCKDKTGNQIEEIFNNHPRILMGSAFRIWRITQVGKTMRDLREAGVKALFITSEYLSSTMRKRLEDAWGAEVYHHYGMTEPGFAIAVECEHHNGFHYNESDLYFEVVDPETGTPVKDGEEGELIFTSLQRDAMPFIRYRTGDIASITKTPCACGTTLSRIGILHKKLGLIYELKSGEKIYASMFDEALYELDELVDYRLWLNLDDDDKDHLHCIVELISSGENTEQQLITLMLSVPEVKKSVYDGLMSPPTVEIVPRETLRRGGRGMKRKIVDKRFGDKG